MSKKDKKKRFPSWVREEDDCMFCMRFTLKPSDIYLSKYEGQEVVQVDYVCMNPSCDYLKYKKGPNIFRMCYGGGYPDAYRAYLNETKEMNQEKIL